MLRSTTCPGLPVRNPSLVSVADRTTRNQHASGGQRSLKGFLERQRPVHLPALLFGAHSQCGSESLAVLRASHLTVHTILSPAPGESHGDVAITEKLGGTTRQWTMQGVVSHFPDHENRGADLHLQDSSLFRASGNGGDLLLSALNLVPISVLNHRIERLQVLFIQSLPC